jgi:putative PEP-CTERM system TPR-repeat lipoprotein
MLPKFLRLALLATLSFCAACSNPADVEQKAVANGDAYVKQARFTEAALEYRNALKVDPRAGDIHAKLGDVLLRTGDVTNALKEYVRAADLLPKDPRTQLKAGTMLLLAGRFEDAQARAEKALALDNNNPDAHILKANALIGLKDTDTAIAQIQSAIQANPERGDTYTNLGAIEMSRGQREAAEQNFRKAVELNPKSLQAQLALGNFYWMSGQWSQAEMALTRAVEIAPDDQIANRAIANYYLATNRFDAAEKPLKKVADLSQRPSDVFALADYYTLANKLDQAKGILNKYVNDKVSGMEANIRLATIEYRQHQPAAAYQRLDGVLKANGDNPKALLVKARLLQFDRRFDDALAAARSAATQDTSSAAAQFLIAQLQVARKDFDAAIGAYQEVLRLNPRATDARVALSQLQLVKGRNDAAVSLAREALDTDPKNGNARLVMVRGLLGRGELDRADAELKQLAAQFPNSAAVEVETGMLEGRRNHADLSRQHLTRALQLDPNNGEALIGLLGLDLLAKRFDAAKARIDPVIAAHPTAPNLVLAARTYAAAGDKVSSERFLRRALDHDPSYEPAYIALGQLFISQGRLAEARGEFEKISNGSPKAIGASTMVGVLMEAQGQTAQARARFEQVLNVDPNAAVAANNLAWLYAQAGDLAQAAPLAERAAKLLPQSAAANDTAGFVMLLRNQPDTAVDYFTRSTAIEPGNALYHYHLGKAYFGRGDLTKAREALTHALQINNSFDGAADAKKLLAGLK